MTENQQGLPGCEHRGGIKWTAPAIAELFDVTDRQVRQWAQENIIPKDRRGEYDLRATVRGVYMHQRKLIERNGADKSLEDLRKEGEELDNEKKRIEIERLRGSLVEKTQIEREAHEEGKRIREGIDAAVLRVRHQVAAETDPRKVEELLRSELNRILESLPEEEKEGSAE